MTASIDPSLLLLSSSLVVALKVAVAVSLLAIIYLARRVMGNGARSMRGLTVLAAIMALASLVEFFYIAAKSSSGALGNEDLLKLFSSSLYALSSLGFLWFFLDLGKKAKDFS